MVIICDPSRIIFFWFFFCINVSGRPHYRENFMCFRALIYVGPANEPLPHAYATANIGYQLTGVVTFSHIQRVRGTAGSSDASVANGFRHSLGKAFYHLILNKHAGPDCQRPRICLSYPAGLFSALPYILHNHEYEPQTPTDPDVHSDSAQKYSHTRMLACTHLRQNTHTICCTIRPEGERRKINIYIYIETCSFPPLARVQYQLSYIIQH